MAMMWSMGNTDPQGFEGEFLRNCEVVSGRDGGEKIMAGKKIKRGEGGDGKKMLQIKRLN
jgi:hypothetical protein